MRSRVISFVPKQIKTSITKRSFSLAHDDLSTSNRHVRNLLENNRRWVEEKNKSDPEFFNKLSRPQKPKYLYFGCSDSRVPANEILGLG